MDRSLPPDTEPPSRGKMPPRWVRFVGLATAGMLGVVMLWTGLPRSTPEVLDNFYLVMRGTSPWLHVTFEPVGASIMVRPYQLLVVLGIFAATLIVYWYRAFALARSWKPRGNSGEVSGAAAILWILLFAFTLLPGRTRGVDSTWPIAVGLVWNLIGLSALGVAVAPVVSSLTRGPRVRNALSRLYVLMNQVVQNSPAMLFVGFLTLFVFVAANAASALLFGHIPHIQDSIGQLFHARIFASGHLTAPVPPRPEFFDFTHMIIEGRWYSQYPPGHTFLLLLGLLAGAPWLVNPLLGAAAVVMIYFLGRELYDAPTARVATLLLAASPFVVLMSSEFMNHASAMLMISIFAWGFFRLIRRPTLPVGIIAGASLGCLINIRPYTAAALAAPFLIYGVFAVWKGGKEIRRAALAGCLILTVSVGLLLYFNYATNGSPLLFGYEKLHGQGHNPGFGRSGWGEAHNPVRGMQQTLSNLNGLNKSLFEWPVPSLLFCAILFASGSRNWRDYFLCAPVALVCFAYFLYWYQDLCFGPRFLYEAVPLVVLLTARGLRQSVSLLSDQLGESVERWKISLSVGLVVGVFFVIGWSVNLPPLLNEMGDSYWGVDPKLMAEVRKQELRNALVFVNGNFGSALPANSPFLDGEVVYARDLGLKDMLLMREFPDRTTYVFINGGLFRLLDKGPAEHAAPPGREGGR